MKTAITTFSVPTNWLAALLPGFAIHGRDPRWIRTSVRTLLVNALTGDSPPPLDVNTANAMSREVPVTTINVSIPGVAGGIAFGAADEYGSSLGPYCKALIGALALSGARPVANAMAQEWQTIMDLALERNMPVAVRPEQGDFYEQVVDALRSGSIGLCEGSTGVGKTLAIMVAAGKIASERHARVVVAAPTVSVMQHACAAYYRLATHLPGIAPLRAVVGRREYVSAHALRALLESDADAIEAGPASRARAWLDAGGLPPADAPLKRAWLIASLLAVTGESFPATDVVLPEIVAADDPGLISYREQFSEARERDVEILICTHAMLAYDNRSRMRIASSDGEFRELGRQVGQVFEELSVTRKNADRDRATPDAQGESTPHSKVLDTLETLRAQRGELLVSLSEDKGLLPPFQYLLVDEAHQLEEHFSSACADQVSLRSVSRLLQAYRDTGGPVPKAGIAAVRAAVVAIAKLHKPTSGETIPLQAPTGDGGAGQLRAEVSRINQVLAAIRPPRSTSDESPARGALRVQLMRMANVMRIALDTGYVMRAFIQYSPVRQYPQLIVGRNSVASMLRLLWDSVAGAALCSATLYLRSAEGYSADYHRRLLALPDYGRVRDNYRPAVASWLTAPVSGLYVPENHGVRNHWLRPPGRADRVAAPAEAEAAERQWIAELAPVVRHITATAAGGTLVLMTSYRSLELLAEHLADRNQRLVVARSGWPIAQQKRAFLGLCREWNIAGGLQPVWLGVGAAWTGIDIGGHDPWQHEFGKRIDPASDNVLTDLVIPRLPFGTNRSLTHRHRAATEPGQQWDLFDASFRMRQGLGRLVRQEGLPRNRRIFVLDGRINDPAFAWARSIMKMAADGYPAKTLLHKDIEVGNLTTKPHPGRGRRETDVVDA